MKFRIILIALIALSVTVLAERTRLKAGFNTFSVEDDVKLGQDAAKNAEKQLILVDNRDANAYIAGLGQKLVVRSPNEYKFPFTFKVVNEREINAFALPGGPVYVHRGAIEAADNEAQLAGVMGHEVAHVILRHGTNQASKGQLAGGLAGLLGGVAGKGVAAQALATLGAFTANSVLLRYSRDAESQADLMGTQILYDAGYDPQAMSQFFEKLAREHKGSKTEQFFSNHPIPENRVTKVNDEIRKIGPTLNSPRSDSAEFQRIKRLLLAMPDPPKAKTAANTVTGSTGKPAATAPPAPSARMTTLQTARIQVLHPDNWKPVVNGDHIILAPPGGASEKGDLSHGLLIDVAKPQNGRTLEEATSQFLAGLQKENPGMRAVRSRAQTRVDNRPAQLNEMTNDSPIGGKERDVIITLLRSNNELLYFVQVAPEKDLAQYQRTFQAIMDSVRLR